MIKPARVLHKLLLVLLLFFLICIPNSFIAADDDVKIIIDRVLEAYGGSALDSVRAFKMEGTVNGLRWCYGGFRPYPVTRVYVQPGDARVDYRCQGEAKPSAFFIDVNYAGLGDTYTGAIAWGDLEGWDVGIRGYVHDETAIFLLPWLLNRHREKVTLWEIKEWDKYEQAGRNLIALAFGRGLSRIYIDPKDYRIHQFQHTEPGWLWTNTTIVFSDFRKVEGVLFPHREEHFAAGWEKKSPGMHTGTVILDKIIINPEIDPAIFQPTEEEIQEREKRLGEYRKSQ